MRGRRRGSVYVVLVTAAAAVGVGLTAPPGAGALGAKMWVAEPVCAAPAAGQASCFAMRLVETSSGASIAGARPAAARPNLANGVNGGYTPTQVAKAYGLNVSASAAATQTVAIVDAFDDPTVKSDLAAFDSHYGIAAETSSSFRVVNQLGATSPLPAPNAGWAGEITLDVQAVRGICRKCKILLIEADSNSTADLATAVNRAVTMHATEISNSYGGIETDASHTAVNNAKFNHPGVVITASTGDDGWYGWDVVNDGFSSDNTAQWPAALNTVVGVSGTSLYLNPDGTRASETVWNNNGPNDRFANFAGRSLGAAGGGCSTVFSTQRWQQFVAGNSTLGCSSGKRSMTDIAAIADPFTGYDVFQTFGATTAGWTTFGGTSLASPMVSAMWALAGGSHGVRYPALTLYGHYKHDKNRPTYDVTVGGTAACSTSSTTTCSRFFGGNPNGIGRGLLDCAFPAAGAGTLANRGQCYARPGYDGVSGVGTPRGVGTFAPLAPTPVIGSPGTVTHNVTKKFDGSHSSDPFPGGSITSFKWNWGDGHTSTGSKPSHKYTSKGTRTITLTVTDNYTRTSHTTLKITVH